MGGLRPLHRRGWGVYPCFSISYNYLVNFFHKDFCRCHFLLYFCNRKRNRKRF